MEIFSETRSKYFAISFTIGIHLLVGLLLLIMGFLNPKEKISFKETSSGEAGVFGFEIMEVDDFVSDPQPASAEKVIADPNEKEYKIENGKADSQTESGHAAESQEYQTALNRMKRFKSNKGKNGNSGGDDSKDGNSLKKNNSEFEYNDSFFLSNRSLVVKPETILNDAEEGIVIVEIIVDENGKVVKATPGARGSTTTSSKLYAKARGAAKEAKFSRSPEGIKEQRGTYTFVFTLE